MSIGMKEIMWEELPNKQLKDLLQKAVDGDSLKTHGLCFHTSDLKLNVSYKDPCFELLLKDKFRVLSPHRNSPCLTFIPDHGRLGFKLPFEHFGYVSIAPDYALVFASSFGIFKSVISGYASMLMDGRGYVPAHASVLSVDGFGLLLVGGSSAGKTTTLLSLIDWSIHSGRPFQILTDDWAVVTEKEGKYIAESFDPSISLRQRNLDENPHLYFAHHKEIQKAIATQKKVSRNPDVLYGNHIRSERIQINAVVLLLPEEGSSDLLTINPDYFSKVAIEAAYHYPYVNADQIKRHRMFWEGLANKIPVFSLCTRGRGGSFQPIDAVKELIYEK